MNKKTVKFLLIVAITVAILAVTSIFIIRAVNEKKNKENNEGVF